MKKLRNNKLASSIKRYEMLAEMPCLIGHYWPVEYKNCGGPMENNHLTSMKQRKTDDQRTYRTCRNHHQAQSPLPIGEAYHKGSKLFRAKYGDDDTLLRLQNDLLLENGYEL